MCGISAVIRAVPGDLSFIQAMNDIIAHRGPDDQGVKNFDHKIALGHRRLSILDLSAAGHQPMDDGKETCWITYNGEIYNYKEIRDELKTLGYLFRTETDTEVILKAYKAWEPIAFTGLMGCLLLSFMMSERKLYLRLEIALESSRSIIASIMEFWL